MVNPVLQIQSKMSWALVI